MNRRLGFYSSVVTALCTSLFFIGLFTGSEVLNYASCLVLSWAYVLTACAYASYAAKDRQALALGGVAIGIIYSVFTNLVYYTQLTTVAYQTADQGLLDALAFRSGTWMFGFDIMGYGLMGLSTLLIGLALQSANRRDRIMKAMLLGHGVFFPICVIMPMLNVFKAGADDSAGILALKLWCLYFAPVMVLSAVHFLQKRDTNERETHDRRSWA